MIVRTFRACAFHHGNRFTSANEVAETPVDTYYRSVGAGREHRFAIWCRGDDTLRGAESHEATEYEPLIAEAQALFSKVWRTVGPPDARARSLITTDPMEAA